MKESLAGIDVATGMSLATHAFASDDLGSRCPQSGGTVNDW